MKKHKRIEVPGGGVLELPPDVPDVDVTAMEAQLWMSQRAPFPDILADLVKRVRALPGWTFSLEHHVDGDSAGLRLYILVRGTDSYRPDTLRSVIHSFIVPAATYNEQSWRRWLFDRCLDVQSHELCEYFRLEVDDAPLSWEMREVRPYVPNHGPGNDPYFVFEVGTDVGRRTRNDGTLSPE